MQGPLIFPLGHPVELVGNAEVLEAAFQLWPACEQQFEVEPLRFAFADTGIRPSDFVHFEPLPTGFVFRSESGRAGFCVESRSGTLSTAELLEPLILTALDWTFFIGIHAACVMREGRSLLLCGDSHAGKSTLTYACARSGWTFVSDNALHWAAEPWDVLVSGSPSLRLREGAQAIFDLPRGDITPGREGLASAPAAPAGRVVFLQRRPGPAAIHAAPLERGLEYFRQYDTRPDRAYAESRYRALLHEGAVTLRYEDAWEAVRCLETLL